MKRETEDVSVSQVPLSPSAPPQLDAPESSVVGPIPNPPPVTKPTVGNNPFAAPQTPSGSKRPAEAETSSTISAAKRPRKGVQKDNLLRCQMNEKYWYLDGSVIIVVGDSLFKLHRSTLARSSRYFEILFKENPDGNVQTDNPAYTSSVIYKLVGKGDKVTVGDFEQLLWAMENAMCVHP